MSDEFGTMNLRGGDRMRELDALRLHYRSHRDTLQKLAAEAPSEHMAAEYQRMIAVIDASLRKIDDLEGTVPHPQRRPTSSSAITTPALPLKDDISSRATAADQPLETGTMYEETTVTEVDNGSRTLLIIAAAVVVMAILGWLIWRSGSRDGRDTSSATSTSRTETTQVVEATPDTVATAAPEPEGAADGLSAKPATQDYGVINKGTRATRQFEIRNNTGATVNIQLARSTCRCLYYEYSEVIAPGTSETVTVTVDAAKAKAGALNEPIQVSAKKDPAVKTLIRVKATIE
jgi:hypothetical protein